MKLRLVTTIVSLLLIVLLLPALALANGQTTDAGVPLFFNGKQLNPEVAPRIIKDVTMVPVRIIAESLGSKVEWNQAAHKVTITKADTRIEMTIDQPSASVNGVKNTLDAAPVLIDGNTLLPVRFIAETMGIEVNWNDVSRAVYLTEKTKEPALPVTESPSQPSASPTDKPATDANGKPLPKITSIAATASKLQVKADSGQLSPTVFALHDPERIVIDIPNAVLDPKLYTNSASKSGSTVSQNVYISNVRYSQFNMNPYSVRIVLDMKETADLSWESGLNTAALAGVLQKGAKYKVVIDPGHGDQDPGAKAVNGRVEKEFNLAMGLKVYALLQQEAQIQPFITRNDDTFVPLDDRAKFANDRNADVFVSIHGNSYLASSTGTETYYYKSDSVEFADIMHKHVTAATGLPDRGVRQQPFRVVKVTNMPAVLLEIGYLSNEGDTALMFDEAFQDKVASAIVAGIKEQLHIP
ncbi:N-acetylmuramoyl-L-alanine amidase family protein [Paenibacillus rigui]|uniref:N-acetylmuramoyl-L-alanine amidase n=1 Tax=Paenibacillus rigui TaxID=554312 RepID=A0A229UGQ9_9BACL|nr:N-acetylmuramoyl-L-alanine amidase family protein [Paenibacillus rigui]OXM82535.1 N-acetylmuramoyl-L-alanine amidase [Paenibacillus rigui]